MATAFPRDAQARLRRAFRYPGGDDGASGYDDSDDDAAAAAAALDEQEQEALIAGLAQQNAARNQQFRLFLLAVPALSAVPYLLGLGRPGRLDGLVALLALTSLASTAWMLYALPPGVTGVVALDRWSGAGSQRQQQQQQPRPLPLSRSPLETYLPYLNAGLCLVLMVTGLLSPAHAPQHWGHVGLGNLPAVVYVVVLAAKMTMGSVDPEEELSALKYDYKGA